MRPKKQMKKANQKLISIGFPIISQKVEKGTKFYGGTITNSG